MDRLMVVVLGSPVVADIAVWLDCFLTGWAAVFFFFFFCFLFLVFDGFYC